MTSKQIKLTILIAILIVIGGLIYWWLVEREAGEGIFSDKALENVPLTEREAIIKKDSFITASIDKITDFAGGLLYDENQNGFKLTSGSDTSLEATYYGVQITKNLRRSLNQDATPEAILEKVHSYFNQAGYYEEEGAEPVFSTDWALAIDGRYKENLGQKIDLAWLGSNSLEKEDLEEAKFDPQYQMAVLDSYNNLPPADKGGVKKRIAPIYLDYYCNYDSSAIPDEDYLREKYYQASIITYFTDLETIEGNCLKDENVWFDRGKLAKISFNDLNDIKEIYWLYRLQKFYELKPDLKKIIAGVERFYSDGGFKEKLTDNEPNLIGVHYAVLFIK